MQGIVKWFNAKKGYGFISGDDEGEYFVHYSDIVADGFRTLNEGDKVAFEVATDNDRVKAVCVKRIEV